MAGKSIKSEISRLKHVTFAMTALLLVSGIGLTANAATKQERNGGAQNGDTQVKLGVQKEYQDVSFEVPLYYTMVVLKGDDGTGSKSKAVLPEGYAIRNKNPEKDLVVAKVSVAGIPASTWKLVERFSTGTADKKELKVSIGDLPLPAITYPVEPDKNIRTIHEQDLTKYKSAFYKDGTYQTLGKSQGRTDGLSKLPVSVSVNPEYEIPDGTDETVTTPAFRVIYTLTTLGADGKPVGVYSQKDIDAMYEGPSLKKANEN